MCIMYARACWSTKICGASTGNGTEKVSLNHFNLIVPRGIVSGATPNNSSHLRGHTSLSVSVMHGPSIRRPSITATSCRVMVASPIRKWKVLVSGLHLSNNAISRGQSSFIQRSFEQVKKPARPTAAMIRSSSNRQRLWLRLWSTITILGPLCIDNDSIRMQYYVNANITIIK